MNIIGSARLRVLVAGATPGSDGQPGDGPAPALAGTLVTQLRRRGHDADSVILPLHVERSLLLADVCAWRMLNLSASNARRIDLVVATAFPAWCARHPRKVAWIVSDEPLVNDQESGDAAPDPDAERRMKHLRELDARALAECRHVFAGGSSTAERLRHRAGIEARLLPCPPDAVGRATSDPAGDPSPVWDSIIEQLLG